MVVLYQPQKGISMSDKFILDESGNPVPAKSLAEWGEWFETAGEKRVVDRTETLNGRVSTVFLGLDHSYGEGPPLLYETMVFDGPIHEETERYSTRQQAEAGHLAMVKRVLAATYAEVESPAESTLPEKSSDAPLSIEAALMNLLLPGEAVTREYFAGYQRGRNELMQSNGYLASKLAAATDDLESGSVVPVPREELRRCLANLDGSGGLPSEDVETFRAILVRWLGGEQP